MDIIKANELNAERNRLKVAIKRMLRIWRAKWAYLAMNSIKLPINPELMDNTNTKRYW
jgi:hypothetical protein